MKDARERHLATCIACKQDVEVLRELQGLYSEEKIGWRRAAAAMADAKRTPPRAGPARSSIARVKGAWRARTPVAVVADASSGADRPDCAARCGVRDVISRHIITAHFRQRV